MNYIQTVQSDVVMFVSDVQKVTAAGGCLYLAGRVIFARGYYTGGKYLCFSCC